MTAKLSEADRAAACWQTDPAGARAIWREGWTAALRHSHDRLEPRAWNRGFWSAILTVVLVVVMLAVGAG